jgi:phospholipid/cholesterol/gamma-HCH transport system ATP-binding protein
VTTIIGKSGIGKSVFLKCIANLIAPDGGEILLDGVAMGSNRRGADQTEGFSFSYMFQNNALFDSLTAFENVALPLREAVGLSAAEVAARVNELLEQLDLAEAGSRYPAELSGGMQKRVALARALVTKPEVVLFDEPTTGLDPERKFGVFDMIADYRERFGFTALLVSHDIPEVFEISDKVAWLDDGKIRFFGDPSGLAADSSRSWSGLLQSQAASNDT